MPTDGRIAHARAPRAAGLALMLAAAALVGAGCGSNDGGSGSGGGAATSKSLRIPLLTTFNGLPFYTAMLCGAQDAAKKLGGDITVTSEGPPHGENVSEQLPILASAVNSKPDGIILVPADRRALVPSVQAAVKRGVPVVTTDQTLVERADLANFHTDGVQGGKLGAGAMLKLLGGKGGSILVLDNKPGLPVTNLRAQGFQEGVKGQSGLKLLATQYNVDDQNKAATQVQAALRAHPDLVGIFATSEAGALGAVSALKSDPAARAKVKVVGYDADQVLVKALKDGVVDAVVSQGSYDEGYHALTTLVRYVRGQLPKHKVTYDNVMPNVVVTKDNMDDPKIKPYIYPAKCSS
jgi:ribose transport system substrate-binding protein